MLGGFPSPGASQQQECAAFPVGIVGNRSRQVKSVKPCLKQLQQCIQTISTLHDDEILPSNPADLFHWLPKEHMCVLVYLVRANYC